MENTKSYYHSHESAYQEIKLKGYVGWGNAESIAQLGDEMTKQYLISEVQKQFTQTKGKNALDLGCGTGTTAFILSQLGFKVTGVDVSETAIEMGNQLALQQNLNIQFRVADVLELTKIDMKFDLIYDSHFMHCIVFENDREKVFQQIKECLGKNGIFILDTMVMPAMGFDPTQGYSSLRFDENYILWHKVKASAARGIVRHEGDFWCAQRRIYPAKKVFNEIEKAGFRIISQQLDEQDKGPSMLRLALAANYSYP